VPEIFVDEAANGVLDAGTDNFALACEPANVGGDNIFLFGLEEAGIVDFDIGGLSAFLYIVDQCAADNEVLACGGSDNFAAVQLDAGFYYVVVEADGINGNFSITLRTQ
jgi:hypothetical protein